VTGVGRGFLTPTVRPCVISSPARSPLLSSVPARHSPSADRGRLRRGSASGRRSAHGRHEWPGWHTRSLRRCRRLRRGCRYGHRRSGAATSIDSSRLRLSAAYRIAVPWRALKRSWSGVDLAPNVSDFCSILLDASRANYRASQGFPPPPGRPAFTTLPSRGQRIHVCATNIASVGPSSERGTWADKGTSLSRWPSLLAGGSRRR
jgi:hypothetical protein